MRILFLHIIINIRASKYYPGKHKIKFLLQIGEKYITLKSKPNKNMELPKLFIFAL